MNATQPVTVESLMLANHAESVNGLLYISGGGCNIHRRIVPPEGAAALSHLGLALIIAVPWHQTNLTHNLTIEFRDEDANVIASINSKLNIERPPGLRPGTMQYANVGLPMERAFHNSNPSQV